MVLTPTPHPTPPRPLRRRSAPAPRQGVAGWAAAPAAPSLRLPGCARHRLLHRRARQIPPSRLV